MLDETPLLLFGYSFSLIPFHIISWNVVAVAEVEKAIKALDSRYFAGRLVRAQPFEQAMFDANDLSG